MNKKQVMLKKPKSDEDVTKLLKSIGRTNEQIDAILDFAKLSKAMTDKSEERLTKTVNKMKKKWSNQDEKEKTNFIICPKCGTKIFEKHRPMKTCKHLYADWCHHPDFPQEHCYYYLVNQNQEFCPYFVEVKK